MARRYDAVIIGAGHNGLVCGASCHPGGVSGIPGHNAAREILKDW
jgi:phytoene dehydrogenase-like protein